MCGIAGIISLNGAALDETQKTVAINMMHMLTHRGPSQSGLANLKRSILCNTRLAIIDRSARSNLPMKTSDEKVWITYNGEISNFRELKSRYRLEDKYTFKGTSDTEVLLYLYKELGISFVNQLAGMFAFCIVDLTIDKAFIVRDFFGIDPVFYHIAHGRLYFASEMKALLEVPSVGRDMNQQAMFHYFTLAYIPGTDTPYMDIQELHGSELLAIDLKTGGMRKERYYDITYDIDHSITEEEAAERAYELMLDSIERNLISDAPIGTTLSGGVDTGTITCLLRDLGKSVDFPTFSIRMGESSFDESRYQRLLAELCGTDHHEIVVRPEDVIENIYTHMAYIDEPCGDGSAIPSYILAKYAKQHVDVLLSGEGGDEVFSAYSTYSAFNVRRRYLQYTNKPMRKAIHWLAHLLPASYKKLSLDFQLKRFTEGAELHPAAAHIYWRHVLTNTEKDQVISAQNMSSTDALMIDLFNESGFSHDFNKINHLDVKHFFIDDLLVKNDRMFMANSIETRFPFMDRFLFEFMATVPPELRIKGFRRRNIQKEAMKNSLPREILNRGNFGLEMPHSIWFFGGFSSFAETYLNEKAISKTGFLNWPAVEKLWNLHISKKRDYGRALWCIILFQMWHEMFIEKSNYKSYLSQHERHFTESSI